MSILSFKIFLLFQKYTAIWLKAIRIVFLVYLYRNGIIFSLHFQHTLMTVISLFLSCFVLPTCVFKLLTLIFLEWKRTIITFPEKKINSCL